MRAESFTMMAPRRQAQTDEILLLGGYGGVGRALARRLLEETECRLAIAGRHAGRAINFAHVLANEYPDRHIRAIGRAVDAADRASLKHAMHGIQLMVVTAPVPEHIASVVEVAIDSDVDVIDILASSDIVDSLEPLRKRILDAQRVVLTQAGFHPGLVAPLLRHASRRLGRVVEARVVVASAAPFEQPSSAREVAHEVGVNGARVLDESRWRPARPGDVLQVAFDPPFGSRACYPMRMREVEHLDTEIAGLERLGVFAAGFNWLVDHFVRPFAVLAHRVVGARAVGCVAHLLHWGVQRFSPTDVRGMEMRVQVAGERSGEPAAYELTMSHDDAYDFTAVAVATCVLQYLDGTLTRRLGMRLMGIALVPATALEDMRRMGVSVREERFPGVAHVADIPTDPSLRKAPRPARNYSGLLATTPSSRSLPIIY